MAKKTYRTYTLRGLDVHLVDARGYRIDVVFHGGIQIDSTAKFTTKDERIQKALEKCSGFGRDFYLESTVEDKPAAKVEEKKVEEKKKVAEPEVPVIVDYKDSRRFKNLVEMKNAVKELGIEIADNANYLAVKAAAAKEGYDFQIQK